MSYLECSFCFTFFKRSTSKFKYEKRSGKKNYFCSKDCQYKFFKKFPFKRKPTIFNLICFECKNNFKITRTKLTPKKKRDTKKFFCSSKCKNKNQKIGGEFSPSWKGGRRQYPSHKGYVMLRVGPNKRVFEHRYVMEKHIGRKLKPKEVIHHLNEDPSDNRIENLVLCKSSGEHHALYHSKKTDKSGRFLPTHKNKSTGKE